MEASVRIGRAISSNKEAGIIKIRCVGWYQFDLYRPLAEPGKRRLYGWYCIIGSCQYLAFLTGTAGVFLMQGLHAAAGTSYPGTAGIFVFSYGLCIVRGGFPFFECNGIGRAMRQTVAQTVTVIVADQRSFATYHGNSSFMAGPGAGTASIAFTLIDMNDFTFHRDFLQKTSAFIIYFCICHFMFTLLV